jgi:predicted helicase
MGLGDQQQRAAWNDYVPKHLLPRLYGYELMMAPYAIAHMKIGLKLYETGYRFGSTERARIYLTNALEPATDDKKQREFEEWAPAVAHEAQAVSAIKRKERFTVMIGNPPYSSAARMTHTAYLTDIMKPFTEGLGVESERKKGALQDDYIRFLALCRHVIRRTGIGIIGLITNNSYIDGTLHRAMRKSLIDSFARLLIVNLHGSSRAGHRGVHDENVFDIMQGVAIVIGATHATSPQFNSVLYSELIGTRSKKYERLATRIPDVSSLQPTPPYFLLRPMGGELFSEYETFVSVGNAFEVISSGIETEKDHFAVDFELGPLRNRLREFCDMSLSSSTVATRFALKSTPNWDLNKSRKALNKEGLKKDLFVRYLFHCFDWRYTYYSDSLITRSRRPVMRHMTQGNLALVCLRQVKGEPWAHVFVARDITNKFTLSSKSSNVSYHLPLFLTFDNSDAPILADEPSHQINLRPEVLRQVSATISDSKTHALDPRAFALKVFFFAYAIFHSPGFRSRYSDYLCLDFPRFPLPATCGLFDQLADLGAKLVSLHLLESRKLDKHLTTYVGPTKPEVEKVSHERCTAWLDKAQTCGFRGVPEAVWNLHIGGYQVCEKWLKDRKGRTLSEDDIEQYHSIVVALSETIRLMDEIDEVIDQHGGWPIGGSGRT